MKEGGPDPNCSHWYIHLGFSTSRKQGPDPRRGTQQARDPHEVESERHLASATHSS